MPAPLLSAVTMVDVLSHPRLYPLVQPPLMRLFEARHPTIRAWPPLDPTSRAHVFPPLDDAPPLGALPSSPPLRMPRGPTAAPTTTATRLSTTWANILGNLHGGAWP